MSDNREGRQNKLVIWAFIGTILVCAISIAVFAYIATSQQ